MTKEESARLFLKNLGAVYVAMLEVSDSWDNRESGFNADEYFDLAEYPFEWSFDDVALSVGGFSVLLHEQMQDKMGEK